MRFFTTIVSLIFFITCSVAVAGVSGTSGPSKYIQGQTSSQWKKSMKNLKMRANKVTKNRQC